jgi:glycosyltransferase involved in cell wall biosynthesis
VAQLGPDPRSSGGMPAVISSLLGSPLAERFRLDPIPTYRSRRPLARLLLFLRSLVLLVRWCAGPGERIVHVHMAPRGSMYRKAVVVAVAKAMRRPVVLQFHAGSADLANFISRLGPARRALLRLALTASDRVLSVSASSIEVLHRLLPEVEIGVIPNAPPPVVVRSRSARRGEVTVLYLGGFHDPAKGGAVMLAALPTLLERTRARVVLAGPGEGPDELPDPERVSWRGWLDAPARDAAFEGADVFAMPSLSEGLPVALLEAMAWGLPIVVSRVDGAPEVLEDGVEAVMVDPGDPEQLAVALCDLVEDAARRRALGEAAAERAARLADEDVYGQLEEVYRSLIG